MRERSGSESSIVTSNRFPLFFFLSSFFFTFHYRTIVVVRICKLRDLSRLADSFVDRRWKLYEPNVRKEFEGVAIEEEEIILMSERRVGVLACIVICC